MIILKKLTIGGTILYQFSNDNDLFTVSISFLWAYQRMPQRMSLCLLLKYEQTFRDPVQIFVQGPCFLRKTGKQLPLADTYLPFQRNLNIRPVDLSKDKKYPKLSDYNPAHNYTVAICFFNRICCCGNRAHNTCTPCMSVTIVNACTASRNYFYIVSSNFWNEGNGCYQSPHEEGGKDETNDEP